MNYTITKKLLFVVHSLSKFRHYITRYETFVHIDNVAIKYSLTKPDVNSSIIRSLLLLQHFDLTIIYKLGKENVVVDVFSKLTLPIGNEEMVEDQLIDEHLFSISVIYRWFVDI